MQALDVNLLSSKLQKQTLDDSQSVKLINPESNYKLSESVQAKLGAGATVKNVLQVSLNSNGKLGDLAFTIPEMTRNTVVTKSLCFHRKHKYSCQLCEDVLCQISSERPMKRHCRSISTPQEVNMNMPQAKLTWQPLGSLLWKPVAERKSNSHAWCDGKWDVRCPPVDFAKFEISSFTQSVHHHVETINSHEETVHQKIEHGHITLDHLITPPVSPVPRPGSVYSDGAISPFTLDYQDVHHFHDFKSQSLSVEEKMCCLTNFTGSNTSMPSSPHHHYRVPRCQSQPSFYDRKSRRKRRRDCRPMINFTKMTQTAYTRLSSIGLSIEDEGNSDTNLMPITSSPRDSNGSMMNAFALSNPGTSLMHEHEITNGDSMSSSSVMDETAENSGPVKLLGEDDQNDTDMEVFQLTEELDLAQIENS